MGHYALAYLRRNPTAILYISILLYTLILSYFAILKHYAFMSTAWDLGIYEQTIWSTVNGRLLWYTPEIAINPSCNFFGIHFSPILFLVMPAYAIFQTTETLLVLQTFFLALGAVPLYKLAFYETHSHKRALIFDLIYLAYPPIHGMALFDFHVQAFLPFLFFSAFYYFKKEEWGKYFLFIILSLMVIEFVSLIVTFFGLYGLWINRRKIFQLVRNFNFKGFLFNKSICFSLITAILGIVWFLIAKKIILSINPSAPPHPNWKNFGDPVHDISGFIFNVLTNPIKTLEAIITPVDQKTIYIFGLFAPVAFLSFLDLPSLMIGFPWFLVAFLSNYPPYYVPVGYQYVGFVVPFIFISAVYGFKRFSILKHRISFIEKIDVAFKGMAIKQPWKALSILFFISIIVISYVTILGIRVNIPSISEHKHITREFISLIPSNASVLTQNDLFPHLSRRSYAYVGGKIARNLTSEFTFDYILVDVMSFWYDESFASLIYNLTKNGGFGVQYASDGLWLLKRNYTGEITYLINNGIFAEFYNQGVTVKLFANVSFNGEADYENVTVSIYNFSEIIPQTWNMKSFALMFEGQLYAPVAGNYLFLLESIGPAKFYLNNMQVLSSNTSIGYYELWLARGFHSIKVEYIKEDYCDFPFVRLVWKPPWEADIVEIQPMFLYSKISPDVSSPFLNTCLNFGSKSPFALINKDYFSAFINCSLYIPSSGVYKFRVLADDYISLVVDGELLLSPFKDAAQNTTEIFLRQGIHTIQIVYMEFTEAAWFSVMWCLPESNSFEEIPSHYLHWLEPR